MVVDLGMGVAGGTFWLGVGDISCSTLAVCVRVCVDINLAQCGDNSTQTLFAPIPRLGLAFQLTPTPTDLNSHQTKQCVFPLGVRSSRHALLSLSFSSDQCCVHFLNAFSAVCGNKRP